MEVIGQVTADLYVRSSLEHADFFARLSVVEPSGKSLNLLVNAPPSGHIWPANMEYYPQS